MNGLISYCVLKQYSAGKVQRVLRAVFLTLWSSESELENQNHEMKYDK